MNSSLALQWKNGLLAVVLFALILGPVVVLGGSKSIYVDEDNKGNQDGSYSHPYRTISKALKQAKGSTTVYVAKGTYKENLTLPKDVKLVGGKNMDDVVIKADNPDQPVITMKDDTEINKLTIVGGRHGVRVVEHARAKIVRSVVKGSTRDGIHIDRGSRDKKEQVIIDQSVIKNNRLAGIYSDKRSLIVTGTDITGNGDGVDLIAEVKAWFEDNRVLENRGSGFKLTIDGASFWSKDNSIRRNGREGVEVNSYGSAGSIGFKKATFIDNGRYAIARVVRAGNGDFSGLTLTATNRYEGNRLGTISSVLRIR
ncbi:MAG: right-handed parallel beta-helix repeat-containing protein [Candidatus Moraniibacteriota bacterium]|nr:MAG: right-handed parallel beta-helix repeat-containing protein [Candidatus Moranbacteria bacterium]